MAKDEQLLRSQVKKEFDKVDTSGAGEVTVNARQNLKNQIKTALFRAQPFAVRSSRMQLVCILRPFLADSTGGCPKGTARTQTGSVKNGSDKAYGPERNAVSIVESSPIYFEIEPIRLVRFDAEVSDQLFQVI